MGIIITILIIVVSLIIIKNSETKEPFGSIKGNLVILAGSLVFLGILLVSQST